MKFERVTMLKKTVLGRNGGSIVHVGSTDLGEDLADVPANGLADEQALGDRNKD